MNSVSWTNFEIFEREGNKENRGEDSKTEVKEHTKMMFCLGRQKVKLKVKMGRIWKMNVRKLTFGSTSTNGISDKLEKFQRLYQ